MTVSQSRPHTFSGRVPRVAQLILRALTAAAILFAAVARADDWPQWMGPTRDGLWSENQIAEVGEEGVPVRWRIPLGGGYAGPAVSGNRVYVTDFVPDAALPSNDSDHRAEIPGQERVACFDTATGDLVWEHAYPCHYNISYPAGPRCTPCVNDGDVYFLGAEGHLICCDAQTGAIAWQRHLPTDYHTAAPMWGYAGHPLVHGDLLYSLAGGDGSLVVAFDKKTGEEVWRALSASSIGYCPPTLVTVRATSQLLIWDPERLHGLDPQTGKEYWSVLLQPEYEMSIAAPQVEGDLLYASGIGNCAVVLRMHENPVGVAELWRGNSKTAVYCTNSTPLIWNDVIYGVDCRTGGLRAVDLLTGERLWETYQPTTGDHRQATATAFLVRNGKRFFLFNDSGDLIEARLDREGYREVGRIHLLEPTGEAYGRHVVWSLPAFAKRAVFARNDRELVCISLSEEDSE